MTVMQSVTEKQTDERKQVCGGGDIEGLTKPHENCLLASGSEDRSDDVNDFFEYKSWSLNESRLAELAIMSSRDVEDIPGARVYLPDTSVEEPDMSGLLVIEEALRQRLSDEAVTSTLLESCVPINSQRMSSMLEEHPRNFDAANFSRVTSEVGDEESLWRSALLSLRVCLEGCKLRMIQLALM